MEVSVVGVETCWGEAGESGDELIESGGVGAWGDAGPVLTGVDVEEDGDCEVAGGGGGADLSDGGFVVGDGGEADVGEFVREVEEAVDGRADGLRGEEDVGGTGGGGHFGFGDGGAFGLGDAECGETGDDAGEFVGFEVRAEVRGVWGEGDHAPEVFLDAVPEDEEGRGGDVSGVGWERGVHGSGEFEDAFDFSGDVAWERSGAEGAAGTDAEFLAEDGGEEFGAAIDDLGVVVEVGG